MTAVLAMDPGGTTGFASWVDGEHEAWEASFDDTPAELYEQLFVKEYDAFACESFRIGQQTLKKSQDGLMSIELIGVGRYLARASQTPFVLQTPGDAKEFSDNAKLRAMGWWTPGKDHKRDASRHLLLFLCSQKIIDLADLRRKLG